MKEIVFEKSFCGEFDCCRFRLENELMIFSNNVDGYFKIINYKDIPIPRTKKLKRLESKIEKLFLENIKKIANK